MQQLLLVITALVPVQQAFFASFHSEPVPSRLRLLSSPPGPWDRRVFAKSRRSSQCRSISNPKGSEVGKGIMQTQMSTLTSPSLSTGDAIEALRNR